jgi:molybdopterin converting factor small subunit
MCGKQRWEDTMNVNLKCFADLAERYDCSFQTSTHMTVADGATVGKVMSASGIAEDAVKIVFVNGKLAGVDQPLRDGDRVTLVPATGGM